MFLYVCLNLSFECVLILVSANMYLAMKQEVVSQYIRATAANTQVPNAQNRNHFKLEIYFC